MLKKCVRSIYEPIQHWTDFAGLMALFIMLISVHLDNETGVWSRWIGTGVILLFAYGIWWYDAPVELRYRQLLILLLASLPILLVFIDVNGFATVLMYFVLSSAVMYMLPERSGYWWIAIFGLITAGVYLFAWQGVEGIFNAVGTFAGYMFFGSASSAQMKAERANTKSQELLQELQEAHKQLQERAAQAEELAASQERNRLAREVHDTLGHRLTVAAVQLEGAEKLIERDPQKARSMVATVRAQVIEGLGELRNTVAALRAPLDEDISLPSALRKLASGFEEATKISTEITVSDDLPLLPDTHRHAIYRAAQESLTNIQRHAEASQTWVELSRHNGRVVLSIRDNGMGFEPERQEYGFGIHGLEERATQLGGQVQIASNANGGTQVTFQIPTIEHG